MKNLFKFGYFRHIFIILAIFIICIFMLWLKAYMGAKSAFYKGQEYLREGEIIKAVNQFDRTLHWYAPFNPYMERAARSLWKIGKQAKKEGDIKMALIAYRTIRRGLIAASSFYTPKRQWIKRVEREISLLMQKEKAEIDMDKLIPRQIRRVPNEVMSVVMEIGFWGWIGGVIGLIFSFRKDYGEKGFIKSKLMWIILIAISYTIWIIGMLKA